MGHCDNWRNNNSLEKRFTIATASCLYIISIPFYFYSQLTLFSSKWFSLLVISNLSCHGWRLRRSAPSSVPVKLHTHLCAFVKWNGCYVQIAFGAFHTNVPSACAHLSWILRYPEKGQKKKKFNAENQKRKERRKERRKRKVPRCKVTTSAV